MQIIITEGELMKKYILEFFKDKKELMIFVGVLLCLIGIILTISKLTVKNTTIPVVNTSVTEPVVVTTTDDDDVGGTPIVEKMILPILGDYEVVLEYFDLNNPSTMKDAIINHGSEYYESNGISYSNLNNTTFDVLAVFSGIVTDIKTDDLEMTVVTIKHSDELFTKYYSLKNVTLKVNDEVELGDVIGKASESLFNTNAGIHVHIEVIKNGEYLNPIKCVNKTLEEVLNITGK